MNHITGKTVLIADSHLADAESTAEFFTMLDRIALSRPAGIVFLGDIFELWVAVRGYESRDHIRFVNWCRDHKSEFEIGFVEGNHEFFVSSRKDAFSWCSAKSRKTGKNVFIHGDLVNRRDWKYRSLRALIRNPATHFLLYLFSTVGGSMIADRIRLGLKPTNMENKRRFPAELLGESARRLLPEKSGTLIAGHFHVEHFLRSRDGRHWIHTLPAWLPGEGKIGLLSEDGSIRCGPWHEFLS